jgi:hypothetical protein
MPSRGVRPIFYDGELVAVACSARVFLDPSITVLPRGHPRRRVVAALCLYARDIDSGELPGPYDDAEAERYARSLLIPDEEFELLADECDERLAERFRVPADQIVGKRADVEWKDLNRAT